MFLQLASSEAAITTDELKCSMCCGIAVYQWASMERLWVQCLLLSLLKWHAMNLRMLDVSLKQNIFLFTV